MMPDPFAGAEARWWALTRLLLLWVGLLAPLGLAPRAAEGLQREYEIKAAFLFNFAKYGEWPATAFTEEQFRFCVVEQADVVAVLQQRLQQQRVRELPISVLALSDKQSNEQLKSCHLLFVSAAVTAEKLQQLLSASQSRPVMLIGEAADFLELGGAVNFFVADGTIHFDVHLDHLRQHQLQLSSKLLRHADRVIGKAASETDRPAAQPDGGGQP